MTSGIEGKEEYSATDISALSTSNYTSKNATRCEKASHEHAQGTGMQPSQSSMSVPSLQKSPPHTSDAAAIALAALVHIPTPLLILSHHQVAVLANYAMGELLGLDKADEINNSTAAADDAQATIQGKSLSQLGIQLVQDEKQNRVSWEVIEF